MAFGQVIAACCWLFVAFAIAVAVAVAVAVAIVAVVQTLGHFNYLNAL